MKIWAIANERGNWLLHVGDHICFREPSNAKICDGIVEDPPRPNKHGVVTHIKVWRVDASGARWAQLVAVRNVVCVHPSRSERALLRDDRRKFSHTKSHRLICQLVALQLQGFFSRGR